MVIALSWLMAGWVMTVAPASMPDRGTIGPLSFDPRGADFHAWVNEFKNQLYRRWPPTGIAEEASGHVTLEFSVARDGSVRRVRVKEQSGDKSVTVAAQKALRAGRFLPLPADYKEASISMQLSMNLA